MSDVVTNSSSQFRPFRGMPLFRHKTPQQHNHYDHAAPSMSTRHSVASCCNPLFLAAKPEPCLGPAPNRCLQSNVIEPLPALDDPMGV